MKYLVAHALLCLAMLTVSFGVRAQVDAPSPPRQRTIEEVCSNLDEAFSRRGFPRSAMMQGITKGNATIAFTVTADDKITNVESEASSGYAFEMESIAVVRLLKCKSGGREQRFSVPFSYKMAP